MWVLDGTNVYVISFVADTRAVLERGSRRAPSNPHESFLLFLDSTADASSLTSAALYREDAKEWVQAATRVMAETHPPPPAVDGGVPTIAGPIDAGIDANVDSGLDGGVVDGGPVDGGPPTDAPTDATADAPKDGATDAPSDAPTDAKADAPADLEAAAGRACRAPRAAHGDRALEDDEAMARQERRPGPRLERRAVAHRVLRGVDATRPLRAPLHAREREGRVVVQWLEHEEGVVEDVVALGVAPVERLTREQIRAQRAPAGSSPTPPSPDRRCGTRRCPGGRCPRCAGPGRSAGDGTRGVGAGTRRPPR